MLHQTAGVLSRQASPSFLGYICFAICLVFCIPALPADEILSGMGTLVFFLVTGYSISLHSEHTAGRQNGLFTTIFMQGFFARVFVGLLFYYLLIHIYGDPFFRHDGIVKDNGTYQRLAIESMYFIRSADFKVLMDFINPSGSQHPTFGIITGFLYSIFGEAKIVMVMFNAMIGGLTSVYVYKIAHKLYEPRTARTAAFLTSFFPLLLCYSAFLLKETLLAFVVTLLVWLIISMQERFWNKIILISLFFVILIFLRRQMFFVLLGCFLVHHFFNVRRMGIKDVFFYLFFIFTAGYILGFTPFGFMGKQAFFHLTKEAVINTYSFHVLSTTPDSVIFKIYFLPEPLRLLAGTVFAWIMPFPPWRGWHEFYRASLMPGATIWLFVIPHVFVGFWYTLKERLFLSILPMLLAFIIPVIISYIGLGVFYRYRMQVTPLMLLFAAAGWERYRKRGTLFVKIYFCLAVCCGLLYVSLKYY